MYIKMLQSTRGSVDGINSQSFEAGEAYEMNDDLGNVFVNVMKVAVLVDSKAPVEAVKTMEKDEKSLHAPENKAIDSAPENKSSKKAK